jgi:NAD-dependent DNA ligase
MHTDPGPAGRHCQLCGDLNERKHRYHVLDAPSAVDCLCASAVHLSERRAVIQAKIQALAGETNDEFEEGTHDLITVEKVGKAKIENAQKIGAQILDQQELDALLAGGRPPKAKDSA